MQTKIIRFLCIIHLICTPLPTLAIGWGNQGKYIIKTGLIALGTIFTYEKAKSWWTPSPTYKQLVELTTINQACVTDLKSLAQTALTDDEINKLKDVGKALGDGNFLTLLEQHKKSAEKCCGQLKKHQDAIQQMVQTIAPLAEKYEEMEPIIRELSSSHRTLNANFNTLEKEFIQWKEKVVNLENSRPKINGSSGNRTQNLITALKNNHK